MAYDSNGSGVFTVRPGLSRADVVKLPIAAELRGITFKIKKE